MASNLRDRGYPSAKSYVPNRSDKRNAVMNGNVDYLPFRGSQQMTGGFVPTDRRDMLDKLLTAYNNRAFGSNAPMVQRIGNDYVTDDTDERAYMSGLNLRNPNGERMAFVSRDISPSSSAYYAGIDNLPFGATPVNKSVTTPLGTFGADYDGDGTASLSYESSPYLMALANLLRR